VGKNAEPDPFLERLDVDPDISGGFGGGKILRDFRLAFGEGGEAALHPLHALVRLLHPLRQQLLFHTTCRTKCLVEEPKNEGPPD
jgi:hypothetical protein